MASKENWDSKNLGGSWKRKIVNPDLLAERKKATFDPVEMGKFILSEPVYSLAQDMTKIQNEHPELVDNQFDIYDMTREEKFVESWRKINLMMKIKPDFFFNSHKSLMLKWYYTFSQGPNPMHLHFSMFTECIKRLASKEQKKKWLQPSNNLNMIGGYVQTELGHGSNVAGLETTATLDKTTDEFVIHTPNIKATKFWPGTVGL